MRRYLFAVMLLAGCATAPVETPAPAEPGKPAPVAEIPDPGSFRLRLSGEPLSTSPMKATRIGMVPFGRWLNAIPVKKTKYGSEFSTELVECSDYGCVLRTEDSLRILVVRARMATGLRMDIYDKGWRVTGAGSISDDGEVAAPVTSRDGRSELWIIRKNERMRTRIQHPARGPVMTRWTKDGLFILYEDGTGMTARRVDIDAGKLVSATLMEPWWSSCRDDAAQPLAVGMRGDTGEDMSGTLSLALHRRGEPENGWLVLTDSVRPITPHGAAQPVKVRVDCYGRINVVSALGEEIWCLRFNPEGSITSATRLHQNIAGDAKAIIIDEKGRFNFLEVEMDGETNDPRYAHFVRLD